MIDELIMVLGAAAIGSCIGSFTTTAALRRLRSQQVWSGRSRCDGCGVGLSYLQTVPVLGYLHDRGACAKCGDRIDRLHLVGEVTGAVVLVAVFELAPPMLAIPLAALGFILLAIGVVDAKTRRIPDVLTLSVALLALLLDVLTPSRLVNGAAASILSFALLEVIRRGFLRFRAEPGLGFGDVKLVAALALWLGIWIPLAVFAAAASGLVAMAIVRPTDGRLPFGPALAVSAWLAGMIAEVHPWPTLG